MAVFLIHPCFMAFVIFDILVYHRNELVKWVQGEAAPGLLASDSSLESNRASRLFLAQFLSCLVQLPPILSTTDILWLSCFCYPLLR